MVGSFLGEGGLYVFLTPLLGSLCALLHLKLPPHLRGWPTEWALLYTLPLPNVTPGNFHHKRYSKINLLLKTLHFCHPSTESSCMKNGRTCGTWMRKLARMKTNQTLWTSTRFLNASRFLSGKLNPFSNKICSKSFAKNMFQNEEPADPQIAKAKTCPINLFSVFKNRLSGICLFGM